MQFLVNWELAKWMGILFFVVAILLSIVVAYLVFRGSKK